MESLKYFFRGTSDGYVLKPFIPGHLIILIIVALGVILILKNQDKLQQNKLNNLLRYTLAFFLLAQQVVLYLWYGFSGYFTIHEGLPLYNCRFAIICAALALLLKKKQLQAITVYWGMFGSTLALFIPTLDPFAFPHYTNVSFFLGHSLLLWTSVFVLFVDKFRVNKPSLSFILRFTTGYHMFVYMFNRLTNSNYCYLISSPVATELIKRVVPALIYPILVIMFWNSLMLGFHYTVNKLDPSVGDLLQESNEVKTKESVV